MWNSVLFVVIVIIAGLTDGRVYYLENMDVDDDVTYPIVEQQSSRDLDLAFSAGDPRENESPVSATRKVYVTPEKSYSELSGNVRRPIAHYGLIEPVTVRRNDLADDVIFAPQKGRKQIKLNGKGEVILELRVIANHDSA